MSQFRFTDQQWHEYQEMPDQGYSHRGFLENAVNTGLAETIRQAKEQAWGEGTEAVALLIPEHEWHDRGLRLPTNPYRSQE